MSSDSSLGLCRVWRQKCRHEVLISVVLSCLATSTFISCTPKAEPLQKIPFEKFTFSETQQVTIIKNDPTKSDQWNVRLGPSATLKEGDGTPLWTFSDGSVQWIDRLVDRGFVLHILDTLSSVQVISPTQEGPLSSFGLEPPFFAFRWKTSNQPEEAELLVGQFSRSPEGRFARILNQITVIQGALLPMLEQLQSLPRLRRAVLLTWGIDEIDVVRWKKEEDKDYTFQAERRSDGWVNAKGKKEKAPVEDWLQALTHLRIERFIDQHDENSRKLFAIKQSPTFAYEFEGRKKEKLELLIQIQDGKIYAWVSSRPMATFELHADSLKHLLIPKK